MLRNTVVALCSIAMLAATFAAPGARIAQAQDDSGLRLITEFQVPNSRDVKFPHVVAANNVVVVTGNAERSLAYAWSKAAAASSFPGPFELGPAEGQPDFSTTSVTRGSDGSIYVAWVNQPERTIYLRQRGTNGSWGPARVVDRGSPFPVKPEVGVNGSGQIFVAWRDPDRPIRYRFSADGGVNWSGTRNVSEEAAYDSPISLAGGPSGSMAVTYTAGEGGRLQIFVGLWNGSTFTVQRVSPSGADYADSTVSVGPDGKVYAAWRGVAESGNNAGVFYAERASDGGWPRSRLASGKVTGTASINADESGNLHFTWVAQPSGGNQLFYAFKPSTGTPRGPIASGNTGTLFNARGYGSIGDGAYNHAVAEEFTGSGLRARYALFQANAVIFGAEPVVENGVARARRSADSSLQVSFRNVAGSPDLIRYAWNRVPGNDDQWLPFATTMRIPVPESILQDTSCRPSTLYTQLQNSKTKQIEAKARSAVVQIDGVVEANVYLDNAFNHVPGGTAGLAGVKGAPGGDPLWTRVPLIYLNVSALSDCNGLTTMSVGSAANALETTYQLAESGYSGIISLPNLARLAPGLVPFTVVVRDGAGNEQAFNFGVNLDEDTPALAETNQGSITATPDPVDDILQDLTFTNIKVTDGSYKAAGDADPNRQFWGFWIANAVEPVDDPANDPSLTWTVVKAPPSVAVPNASGGTDYTVTLKDWSLGTGLTREQRVAGEDYFVYVRFLDGAGNPTTGVLRAEITASKMDLVNLSLPTLVMR